MVIPVPANANFVEGGSVNLSCVSMAHPPPTYVWQRRGRILALTDRYLIG